MLNGVLLAEGMFFEGSEIFLPSLDRSADSTVPGGIAIFQHLCEASVGTDGRRNLESPGKGIHATDVRMEEIDRLKALASDLRIEVEAAGGESSHLQNDQHHLRCEVDTCRKLISVPSDQLVTRIGVNRAERPSGGGDFAFVMHRMPGQGGVIGLEVQLEMLEQPVFAEKVETRCGVEIILVFGRFFWFWLDVEGTCETDLFLIVDCHVQEPREVIDLSLEVRVPEACISLPATPEGVTRAP